MAVWLRVRAQLYFRFRAAEQQRPGGQCRPLQGDICDIASLTAHRLLENILVDGMSHAFSTASSERRADFWRPDPGPGPWHVGGQTAGLCRVAWHLRLSDKSTASRHFPRVSPLSFRRQRGWRCTGRDADVRIRGFSKDANTAVTCFVVEPRVSVAIVRRQVLLLCVPSVGMCWARRVFFAQRIAPGIARLNVAAGGLVRTHVAAS